MSDTDDHSGMPQDGLPEDELLAAELALGVLAGADRAAAEARAAGDSTFAALVAHWEQRLAPWAGELAEVEPPPQLWGRIAAALPVERPQYPSIWGNIGFWRGFALASALAAVCLAVIVYFGAVTQQAPLVAALDGGGKHAFVATIDVRRGTMLVTPAALSIPAGRVPELWLVPPGEKPRALGLIDPDKTVALTIPGTLLAQATTRATLAVSLEPPGGSPTGQPTGPVIASGKFTKL
jgi:anti-sigma-K factor RskA